MYGRRGTGPGGSRLLSEATEALQLQPTFRRGKSSSLILEDSGDYQQTLREKYTGEVRALADRQNRTNEQPLACPPSSSADRLTLPFSL